MKRPSVMPLIERGNLCDRHHRPPRSFRSPPITRLREGYAVRILACVLAMSMSVAACSTMPSEEEVKTAGVEYARSELRRLKSCVFVIPAEDCCRVYSRGEKRASHLFDGSPGIAFVVVGKLRCSKPGVIDQSFDVIVSARTDGSPNQASFIPE